MEEEAEKMGSGVQKKQSFLDCKKREDTAKIGLKYIRCSIFGAVHILNNKRSSLFWIEFLKKQYFLDCIPCHDDDKNAILKITRILDKKFQR